MTHEILFAPADPDAEMVPDELTLLVADLGGYRKAADEIGVHAASLYNYAKGLRRIPKGVAQSLREAVS